MITLLLIIIYIIFIGLGLPDSAHGSAWPAIYVELNFPVSYASIITVLISVGTFISSFFSAKLINKLGTGMVTFLSSILTALSVFLFAFGYEMWFFALLSIPLGIGAGAIDSALNNYVAMHYNSLHMSLLHCFYGVGVASTPFIMSLVLGKNNDWRLGYIVVGILLAVIAIISLFALPVWKKVNNKFEKAEEPVKPLTLKFRQMAKVSKIRWAWVIFFTSVGLEFTCTSWCCTYLVSSLGLTEAHAASFLTYFYLGLTLGRLASAIVSKFLKPMKIVYLGLVLVGVAIVILFFPLPLFFKGASLFLIGFGIGPCFPNLTYLTPINFGKNVSQSIVSSQMASCYFGILVLNPLFGIIIQFLSTDIFPVFIAVLFVITVISLIAYDKTPNTIKN